MYHDMPEPECSQCGKSETEQFQRRWHSGIRCVLCGHERVTEDRRITQSGKPSREHSWTYQFGLVESIGELSKHFIGVPPQSDTPPTKEG